MNEVEGTRAKRIKRPPTEPENLYEAARLLSKQDRKALGMIVTATIYVQDPLVAKKYPALGLKPIELDWDPGLTDGPTSARVAVVDYNADTNVLAEHARWDPKEWCFVGSDDQPIGRHNRKSPQFRQVNVWAVIQNILTFYQHPHMLGRAIPWAFEGNRLIVVPQAGYAQNAFYDRRSKSLQFYYCGPPENTVYTCLSHDIIAHETGHAILDGIRPYYNELSSIQTAAFHEFLADLTAILSTLRNNHVRRVVADDSKGDLSKEEVIGDLAEKFGQNIARSVHGAAARPYLRTAHNDKTMEHIKGNWKAHDCSLVLTGGMFEILTKMVLKHLRPDESTKKKGESPRRALWNATNHFTRIALRALDYCPTVDVQFIDYARAVLHADKLAYPRDALEYRAIIREVLHKRGFCNRSKKDHGGLCDLDPQVPPYSIEFRRYDIERLSRSRTAAYHFLNMNRALLHIPINQDIAVVDLYDTEKEAEAGRKLPKEIVLEYIWREDVPLQGARFGELEGQTAQLLCGGTLVFDGRGNVLYFVHKPGIEYLRDRKEGRQRREQLLDYVASLVKEGRIGMADEAEAEGLDAWTPAVVGRRVYGGLRLEVTPNLRHHGGE